MALHPFHSEFDLFGNLPLEINLHITQYLDIYQIYQLQRVCSHWSDILSSPRIIEPKLRPWYGESLDEASIQLAYPNGSSLREQLSTKAAHVDAFRTGTAFSMAMGKMDVEAGRDFPSNTDYNKGLVAWATKAQAGIVLRCLITGREATLTLPEGYTVGRICVSASLIVAFVRQGDVRSAYAWERFESLEDIGKKDPRRLDLDLANTTFYFVMDKTLAVSVETSNGFDMVVWDGEENAYHRFPLSLQFQSKPARRFFHLCNQGKSVVSFERYLGDTSRVHFTRYNLKGEIQSKGSMEHPNIDDFTAHSEHTFLIPTNKHIPLWSYIRTKQYVSFDQGDRMYTWEIVRISYNTLADRFEITNHNIERTRDLSKFFEDFFWWKDVAYCIRSNRAIRKQMSVLNLGHETYHLASMDKTQIVESWLDAEGLLPKTPFGPSDPQEEVANDWLFLGDEKFLVRFQSGFYTVWCFDRHTSLANESQEYKKMMLHEKQQRLQDKEQHRISENVGLGIDKSQQL